MVTVFWIDNQEFEMRIDRPNNKWVLYNYTLQTIMKEGKLK